MSVLARMIGWPAWHGCYPAAGGVWCWAGRPRCLAGIGDLVRRRWTSPSPGSARGARRAGRPIPVLPRSWPRRQARACRAAFGGLPTRHDLAAGGHKAAPDGVGGGGVVAGQAAAQGVVGGLRPDGQGGVQVDVEGHGRGERVEVEGADLLGQALFDGHALGVAADQLGGLGGVVVGEDQGGLVMAQAADGELAQPDRAAPHPHQVVVDLGVTVGPVRLTRAREARVQQPRPDRPARPRRRGGLTYRERVEACSETDNASESPLHSRIAPADMEHLWSQAVDRRAWSRTTAGGLGRRPHLQLVDQLVDIGGRVAAVATERLQER